MTATVSFEKGAQEAAPVQMLGNIEKLMKVLRGTHNVFAHQGVVQCLGIILNSP